jgi:hypothetical protein
MEISEGNRLIICNELKKLSNAKELMEPKPKPIKEKVIRNKDFERIYKNIDKIFSINCDKKTLKIKYEINKYPYECLERWILGTSTDDDIRGILILRDELFKMYIWQNAHNTIIQLMESKECKINFIIKQKIIRDYIECKCDRMRWANYGSFAYYSNKHLYN